MHVPCLEVIKASLDEPSTQSSGTLVAGKCHHLWPAWQRMRMASQACWGLESAAHCCPVTTYCSRPGGLEGAGYQTHPAVTILWGTCILDWDEPRYVSGKVGRGRRRGKRCPLLWYHLPMWLGSTLKYLILLMPDPKLGDFLPCPIAYGRYLSPVHPCRNPSEPSSTDHIAKQQSPFTVIPYSPRWMEPQIFPMIFLIPKILSRTFLLKVCTLSGRL